MTRRRPEDAAVEEALRHLGPALDAVRVPPPPEALVERTLLAARAELARLPETRAIPAAVAPGFGWELARLVAVAALPLLVVVAWNVLLVRMGGPLLEAWLPEGFVTALLGAYALGVLGWTALVFGTLPFAAHRRAWRRRQETR